MNIGTYLAQELNNPAFSPPQLMKDMVLKEKLGRKWSRFLRLEKNFLYYCGCMIQ